jgi:hypothetical protein
MDLLTTYAHDSELQAITAPSLISPIHKSPAARAKPFSACHVFTIRFLTTFLAVEILQLHALRSSLHRLAYRTELNWTQPSQSQSYLTSGSLPTISSYWNQASWDPRPGVFFFFNWTLRGNSPYATSALTRGWVCLLRICLAFRQVYVSHIEHVVQNSSFCSIHKSSVNTGFSEQIMPIFRILCYNGSLIT